MSLTITKLQVDAIVDNLHVKLTPQTVYVSKKTGLTMRRATKKVPAGSFVIGKFSCDDTSNKVRIAVTNAIKNNQKITYTEE